MGIIVKIFFIFNKIIKKEKEIKFFSKKFVYKL